jgi:hypothetical protein
MFRNLWLKVQRVRYMRSEPKIGPYLPAEKASSLEVAYDMKFKIMRDAEALTEVEIFSLRRENEQLRERLASHES